MLPQEIILRQVKIELSKQAKFIASENRFFRETRQVPRGKSIYQEGLRNFLFSLYLVIMGWEFHATWRRVV